MGGCVGFIEFLNQQTGQRPVEIFSLALVYIGYVGGLPAGVISAITFGVYVHLLAGVSETMSLIINAVNLSIILLINWLIYDARMSALNGSFQKVLDALSSVRRLKRDWPRMSEEERFQELFIIEDRLGNSAANVIGWRELRNQTEANKRAVVGEGPRESQ